MTAQAVLGYGKNQEGRVQEALLEWAEGTPCTQSAPGVTVLSCLLLNATATPRPNAHSLLWLRQHELKAVGLKNSQPISRLY